MTYWKTVFVLSIIAIPFVGKVWLNLWIVRLYFFIMYWKSKLDNIYFGLNYVNNILFLLLVDFPFLSDSIIDLYNTEMSVGPWKAHAIVKHVTGRNSGIGFLCVFGVGKGVLYLMPALNFVCSQTCLWTCLFFLSLYIADA